MIKRTLYKILKCPLCLSNSFNYTKAGYKNLYSEIVSNKFKINEEKLINILKNVICKNCGLIYKKKWLKDFVLKNIFNTYVPVHPKGWDKYSRKFNRNYFNKQIKKLVTLLKEENKINKNTINFFKRDIISIIKSIDEKNINNYQNNFIKKFIQNINLDNYKKIIKNSAFVSKLINKPKNYSRFSGMGSIQLLKFINSVHPNFKSYIEFGCPLWGNFDLLKKKKISLNFVTLKPSEFWGASCCKNNYNCIKKASKFCNVLNYNQLYLHKYKFDVSLNIFCLDHLKEPFKYIKNLIKISKTNIFILEKKNKGIPIQHLTGWNKKPFLFLAKKFNKKILYNANFEKNSDFEICALY